jgi:hypothetical protein
MATHSEIALVSQGGFFGSYHKAYPSDTAKRDALHRCSELDPQFSRFSQRDRSLCYRAIMPVSSQAEPNGGDDE